VSTIHLLKETLGGLLYSARCRGDSHSRDAKSALIEEIVTPEPRHHDHAGGRPPRRGFVETRAGSGGDISTHSDETGGGPAQKHVKPSRLQNVIPGRRRGVSRRQGHRGSMWADNTRDPPREHPGRSEAASPRPRSSSRGLMRSRSTGGPSGYCPLSNLRNSFFSCRSRLASFRSSSRSVRP